MSDKVVEISGIFEQDEESKWVSQYWDKMNQQRSGILSEWREIDSYLYATDTRTTSNRNLPHHNNTTRPKLTQIMDNLHSNYISALFPNDKWLRWLAYDGQSAQKKVSSIITNYMANKAREGNLRTKMSQYLYDYIKKGNAFAMPAFESRYVTKADGSRVADFIGPKSVRIDPTDIVFNPTAQSFEESSKCVRSLHTEGDLLKSSMTNPELFFWKEAVDERRNKRTNLAAYSISDINKAEQYSIDGFGNLLEYYNSNVVEVLEFYGDYYNILTGELQTNRVITVVDRSKVVRNEPINTYSGRAPIRHVGWRLRGNNLWAMSPLANLVGMQYRIDHLENAKADAVDLTISPPLLALGEFEDFTWAPNTIIRMDEGGDLREISKNLSSIIQAESDIKALEDEMELFAGAPKEAMGVRSPGEKTMFEVQSLQNASSKIFQERITHFEINFLEPHLNDMLESAHRNLDEDDVVRILDDDLGVQTFVNIKKEDIIANGILRPVGARHYAAQAQSLQNLIGVVNSPLAQMVAPHTSGIELAKFLTDSLDFKGYDIFQPNIGVLEARQTQSITSQAQEELDVEDQVDMEAPTDEQDLSGANEELGLNQGDEESPPEDIFGDAEAPPEPTEEV